MKFPDPSVNGWFWGANNEKKSKKKGMSHSRGGVPKVGQCPSFPCFCYLMAPLSYLLEPISLGINWINSILYDSLMSIIDLVSGPLLNLLFRKRL